MLTHHSTGYTVFQIEISKNYRNIEWREDLKTLLREAGSGANPMTFLFSDTQIKNETFVEDINNMLNNGEVPNIFPSDERAAIAEAVCTTIHDSYPHTYPRILTLTNNTYPRMQNRP